MRKGFTLIELLVAMAVLALMIAFASMVFKVSIDTYRVSTATAEIMQKLRAVTDQLDADFKGLRKDAPLLVWFEKDSTNTDPNRYDQIMFFADGDFSSIQLYHHGQPDPVNGATVVRGNVARVFYGQAKVNNVDPWNQIGRDERKRILARRQHISDPNMRVFESWPEIDLSDFSETFDGQTKEDRYEHDTLALAEWQSIDGSRYTGGNSVTGISFNNRVAINISDSKTYHKLLCEGLGSYSIQWAYWDDTDKKFYWFPDGAYLAGRSDKLGVCFNVNNLSATDWTSIDSIPSQYREDNPQFFPKAIKFTFRLYDSKGVIRDGMEFSHIVYLEK